MIIAVDGPAASGKGTIARALAQHFALPYLDTGLLYRAVAVQVLRNGGDPHDEADAARATAFPDALLADDALRSEAASRAASIVSAHTTVRAALLDRQRRFAAQPGGAVLDGRDIGTVIAPHADAKLFVTAPPEVRAGRRFRQLQDEGRAADYGQVLADIRARDARDSGRATAPLKPAPDAIVLDSADLTVAQAVDAALRAVGRNADLYGKR